MAGGGLLISMLPGDWHVVPAPVATQVFCSGVDVAAAVGAARTPTTAAPTANSGVKWVSLIRMVVLLRSMVLSWICLQRYGRSGLRVWSISMANNWATSAASQRSPIGIDLHLDLTGPGGLRVGLMDAL